MSPARATAWLVSSALMNLLGARLLDWLGLVEGLLAPQGWRLLLIVPLAVSFYAARFIAWFVAPGLLLGALLVSFRKARLTSGD
ncbi:MAG: hypothetical protein EOO73_21155 [Myxococcales bacterium]|nr:MAG: hypothetical protein EOO73_21155 [Myxococcales bacterium]